MGRSEGDPAQPFQPLAIVGFDPHLGVKGESFDVAAQLPRHEERAVITTAAAHPLDPGATPWTECHATLDGSCAELGEQRLVGLGPRRLILLLAREPAEAAEVAQDAAVEDGVDLDDVLVGERRGFMEDGRRERILARVDAVDHERMEVKIEVERAPEALGKDDGAGSAARYARTRRTLA